MKQMLLFYFRSNFNELINLTLPVYTGRVSYNYLIFSALKLNPPVEPSGIGQCHFPL